MKKTVLLTRSPELEARVLCCNGFFNVNSMGFWHLHLAKHGSFSSQWLGQSLSIALPLCFFEFYFQFRVKAHPNLWGEMSSIESSMKEDTTRISSSLGLGSLEMHLKLWNWRLVHVFNNIVNKNMNQNIGYLPTHDTGTDWMTPCKSLKHFFSFTLKLPLNTLHGQYYCCNFSSWARVVSQFLLSVFSVSANHLFQLEPDITLIAWGVKSELKS